MLLRGFWKRWTFLLCFCLFAIAFIFHITNRKSAGNSTQVLDGKFEWLYADNSSLSKTCRNSKQGPHLIADEKGFICNFEEVMRNGCCNPTGNSTEQHSCMSCKVNRCCKVYENCISCCLQPKKRKLLELVLRHAQTVHDPLLSAVDNLFDLCLNKCRTSSSSVRQENVYRDSVYKYCYSMDAPSLVVPSFNAG